MFSIFLLISLPLANIAEGLRSLGDASNGLLRSDGAKYLSDGTENTINITFSVAPRQIDDLLVKESLVNEANMILSVKKPDLIGESMWEFVHAGRMLEAKIMDRDWLSRFKRGEFPLYAGSAIVAHVRSTIKYGFENEVVSIHYEVLSVNQIRHSEAKPRQVELT